MISLPRNDLEKQEILQKIAKKFEKGKEYSEPEVNEIIQSFGVDDYVMIRREFINFNYLGKNTAKGIYWLKKEALSKEELASIRTSQEKMQKKSMC